MKLSELSGTKWNQLELRGTQVELRGTKRLSGTKWKPYLCSPHSSGNNVHCFQLVVVSTAMWAT